jgi:hypothetical protein
MEYTCKELALEVENEKDRMQSVDNVEASVWVSKEAHSSVVLSVVEEKGVEFKDDIKQKVHDEGGHIVLGYCCSFHNMTNCNQA